MEIKKTEEMKIAPSYVYLENLGLNNDSNCVVARLLRKWEARNFKRNKELMSVDFLLLDEKDCLIQGSIHHLLLQRFNDTLKEGRIFTIRDFDVVKSGKSYRVTDHPYMIRFTDATKMEETDGQNYDILREKFCFHTHAQLLQLVNKSEDLPDVIGFLCTTDKPGKSEENKTRRLSLYIYLEENIKARLTVWDDVAESIEKKLQELNKRTIVIVATSLLPKKFGGNLCLNVTSATKIYLNADFQEVRDFHASTTFRPLFHTDYYNVVSNNSETQLHSIAELLEFVKSEKEEEKEFACKAKITEVILRNGWNYISCSNCARKMEKTKSTLTCNNCNDPKAVGILRFRIEVTVEDENDTTTFVIFDKEAKKITNTTASALKADIETEIDKSGHDQAPSKILDIVGKVLKFQVKVTRYNYNARIQSFTVSRILDDISQCKIEEPLPKDTLVIQEENSSSGTSATKIKIEEEKETAKPKAESAKRRKLQKNV